ncbi:hypothetical protein [Amnibacterium setariae]|nr:hypothetical protein [Amnibacterium setariae]
MTQRVRDAVKASLVSTRALGVRQVWFSYPAGEVAVVVSEVVHRRPLSRSHYLRGIAAGWSSASGVVDLLPQVRRDVRLRRRGAALGSKFRVHDSARTTER